MDNKKNSIKEILISTKDLLIKNTELSKEKVDFDAKLSKALEGNILTLNKLSNNDTIEELDQRSKKITQIVEFQSNETLLLNKEVKEQSEPLLLNNEIIEKNKKIDEKDIQNDLEAEALSSSEINEKVDDSDEKFNFSVTQNESTLELNKEESATQGKNYLSILERIQLLEEQKKKITKKLDESIEETRLKDPSDEISLKFDILSNQISNDIDSKIDFVTNEINTVNEEKDGIYQELNNQKELVESGFSGLEASNENLKKQIDTIDLKIEDGQKNQETSIENKLQSFENKIEENMDGKLLLIENKINSKLQELQSILEEDKKKRILEEQEKNNDPDHQANLRLSSIYKILEAQMSQSLINNNLNINKEKEEFDFSRNENRDIKNASAQIHSLENSNLTQKTNKMLESILHSTHALSQEIQTLKKQESNQPQPIESSKIELINSQLESLIDQKAKLDKIHEKIYSLSNQQSKSDEIENKIDSLSDQQSKIETISKYFESLSEEKNNLNSTLSSQLVKLEDIFSFLKSNPVKKDKTEKLDDLIKYFKSSELEKMNHIQFDFAGIQQFEDLKSSKKFLEKLILSETQNWIKLNQKTIEEISKKLLYK